MKIASVAVQSTQKINLTLDRALKPSTTFINRIGDGNWLVKIRSYEVKGANSCTGIQIVHALPLTKNVVFSPSRLSPQIFIEQVSFPSLMQVVLYSLEKSVESPTERGVNRVPKSIQG